MSKTTLKCSGCDFEMCVFYPSSADGQLASHARANRNGTVILPVTACKGTWRKVFSDAPSEASIATIVTSPGGGRVGALMPDPELTLIQQLRDELAHHHLAAARSDVQRLSMQLADTKSALERERAEDQAIRGELVFYKKELRRHDPRLVDAREMNRAREKSR